MPYPHDAMAFVDEVRRQPRQMHEADVIAVTFLQQFINHDDSDDTNLCHMLQTMKLEGVSRLWSLSMLSED